MKSPADHRRSPWAPSHPDIGAGGSENELLRGAIVNRTYGIHKTLYISPFLLTTFGPINYGPPVIHEKV